MKKEQVDRLKECEGAIEQLKNLQKHLSALYDDGSLGSSVSINIFGDKEQHNGPVRFNYASPYSQVNTDDWSAIDATIELRLFFWQQEIEKI